jgi:hypothetical protein
MHALLRGYFNQQANAEKFRQLHKYQIRLRPQDAKEEPKTFCYTYRNQKDQKFGVFIPTHIDDPSEEVPRLTIHLKQALGFLIDYRDKRTRLEDEFFLLPLMDNANNHWTVLKIKLKKDGHFKAKYYDGAFFKRNAYPQIQNTLHSMLGVPTKAPLLLEQVDPFDCGPLSFKMIRTLAKGEEPPVLPLDPCSLRNNDLRILIAASREQAKFHSNPAHPGPFYQLDVEKPDKPFWVRHRGKILIGAISLTVAITVALIIFFPPAILVPAVGAIASATSFNALTMAALGATMAGAGTAFVSLASSLIVDGVRTLWKHLKGKNKPRPEFSYDANENGFASVECSLSEKSKRKITESRRTDVLQMAPLEDEQVESPVYSSPIGLGQRRKSLSEGDFENFAFAPRPQ